MIFPPAVRHCSVTKTLIYVLDPHGSCMETLKVCCLTAACIHAHGQIHHKNHAFCFALYANLDANYFNRQMLLIIVHMFGDLVHSVMNLMLCSNAKAWN